MYRVELSVKVQKQLRKIDNHVGEKITGWLYKNIDGCENPRLHGKALTGNLGGLWRYRIGDYRVIAEIKDDRFVVLAVSVDHRKQVYK